jgi:hypothetical protein
MNLEYELQPDKVFSHWMNYSVEMKNDDFNRMMDITEWMAGQFGPIGEKWGYEKTRDAMPTGGVLFNSRNLPMVHYSWRFLDKSDAMLFKLTWFDK